MTAPVLSLAKKMERALRNGTGFTVTVDEMLCLSDMGVLGTIQTEKLRELQASCPARTVRTSSGNIGSNSGVIARTSPAQREFGKPHDTMPPLDRSSIAALARSI